MDRLDPIISVTFQCTFEIEHPHTATVLSITRPIKYDCIVTLLFMFIFVLSNLSRSSDMALPWSDVTGAAESWDR